MRSRARRNRGSKLRVPSSYSPYRDTVCCRCAIQIRRFGKSYGLFLTTQGPAGCSFKYDPLKITIWQYLHYAGAPHIKGSPTSRFLQHHPSTFAASSPTSTPLRAVKFANAPCFYAMNGCATTLRAYHLRTRRPRSALQGRMAPTKAVSAHSASLNFQSVRPSRHNLRGIFADVDAIARRKVR